MNKLLLGIMLSGVLAFSAVSPVSATEEEGNGSQQQTSQVQITYTVLDEEQQVPITTAWYYWLTSDDHLKDACNIQ